MNSLQAIDAFMRDKGITYGQSSARGISICVNGKVLATVAADVIFSCRESSCYVHLISDQLNEYEVSELYSTEMQDFYYNGSELEVLNYDGSEIIIE